MFIALLLLVFTLNLSNGKPLVAFSTMPPPSTTHLPSESTESSETTTPETTTPETTTPETTTEESTGPPMTRREGCYLDGRFYEFGEDITRGRDINFCYGSLCDYDGSILLWDDWNCGPTTPATTAPPWWPETTPPETTTPETTTPETTTPETTTPETTTPETTTPETTTPETTTPETTPPETTTPETTPPETTTPETTTPETTTPETTTEETSTEVTRSPETIVQLPYVWCDLTDVSSTYMKTLQDTTAPPLLHLSPTIATPRTTTLKQCKYQDQYYPAGSNINGFLRCDEKGIKRFRYDCWSCYD